MQSMESLMGVPLKDHQLAGLVLTTRIVGQARRTTDLTTEPVNKGNNHMMIAYVCNRPDMVQDEGVLRQTKRSSKERDV